MSVAAAKKARAIVNPATEAVLAEIPDADSAAVGKAVSSAKKAFESGAWSGKSPA